MKFSQLNMLLSKSPLACGFLAALVVLFVGSSVLAQGGNPAANLEQCRNGALGNIPCDSSSGGGSGWVTGNVGASQSQWAETQYLPYRMTFTNLIPGTTYYVVIGYDRINSGKHAIDYLGTYNTSKSDVFPCDGILPACPPNPDTIPIPVDPVPGNTINQPNDQKFTMWGGNMTAVDYGSGANNPNPDIRRIMVTFIPDVSNPVLAWGGHVAWAGEWGAGQSAGGISGSPYHMRLYGLGTSPWPTAGGNQDRSLAASAVAPAALFKIIKVANTVDPSGVAITHFPFTVTYPNATPINITIQDNVSGSGGGVYTSSAVAFTSPGIQTATVTENAISGWSLADLACNDPLNNDTTTDWNPQTATGSTSTIKMSPGETVTCTYTNTQLAVTAAPADVAGRVMTESGMGIRGAVLTLTNLSTGEVKTTLSNPFGFYKFPDLSSDDLYTVSVSSKRYSFINNTHTFTLRDSLLDLNFIAASSGSSMVSSGVESKPAGIYLGRKVEDQ